MALAFDVVSIRNTMLDSITTRAGASALLRFYDSTGTGRPATGAAVTTQVKLAELVCNATFAPASSGGILTLNAIAAANALATGTCTWFRIVKADGTTFVMDGNVGTSGSDLNMNATAFTVGVQISVTAFTVTEGNP